jgi:thiamine-monophosphate kinase
VKGLRYNRAVKVSELGEFALIERLARALGGRADGRLAVGIGDDAAVWRTEGGALIATTDTMVSGVHFLPERTPWRDLGWKALAVNVSDVAAMGGTPELAVVTLGLPTETDVARVEALYDGLAEAAGTFGAAIAGGDIVRAPAFFVSVALVGRAEVDAAGEPLVLRRDAARAGDVIAVTGSLGGSGGGLLALRDGGLDEAAARPLIERHLRPQPRLRAGRTALAAGVHCAIDVSDGLLQDLGHVCRARGLGAVVRSDALPIDPALAKAGFAADEALRLAASGGEDYELVLVGARERIDAAARESDVPLTVIGEMIEGERHEATLLDASGSEIALPSAGWDHLRPS